MKLIQVWQEYDCPHACDFDLHGDNIVVKGEKFDCSGCGSHHHGGEHGTEQTMLEFDNGEIDYRKSPADAQEKAALLALVGQEFPDKTPDRFSSTEEVIAFAEGQGLVPTEVEHGGISARVWTGADKQHLARFAALTAALSAEHYCRVFHVDAEGALDLLVPPAEKAPLFGSFYLKLPENVLVAEDADPAVQRKAADAVAHAVAHKVALDVADECTCELASMLTDSFRQSLQQG